MLEKVHRKLAVKTKVEPLDRQIEKKNKYSLFTSNLMSVVYHRKVSEHQSITVEFQLSGKSVWRRRI